MKEDLLKELCLVAKNGDAYTVKNVLNSYEHHLGATVRGDDARKQLMLSFVNSSPATYVDGRTPLHCAAQYGIEDGSSRQPRGGPGSSPSNNLVFTRLLEKGANPNSRNIEGKTPAHIIAETITKKGKDLSSDIDLLKERGADLALKDNDGNTPYDLARKSCNIHLFKSFGVEITEVINEWKNGNTMLHDATYDGKVDTMEKLITFGAKIDIFDDTGCTPLMHAAHYNSIDSVKFLLDRGANFNIKNDKGETALNIALEQSKKWSDIDGNYHSAIERKCNNIKILKALGVVEEDFINDFDKNGNTMLHYASNQGNVGIIKFLLENGAKADTKNLEGKTAFEIAEKKDNNVVLDLLRKSIENPSQSAGNPSASTFGIARDVGRGN